MKKILLNFILFQWYISVQEEDCGYFGEKGLNIEKKLDECFEKNVKDTRVRMSLGFEICFGYNYQKLNDTVAEPIQKIVKD